MEDDDSGIRVREHRGQLGDSLATTWRVKDKAELVTLIREQLSPFHVGLNPEQVQITPYGFDARCGWDTYLITVYGYGVWGMADGPVE